MSIKISHPLPASTLSDGFGWRAGIHTPNGWVPPQLHNGQDYAAAPGSIIRAAHNGRVTYVGWDALGGGWMVKLSSANVTTMYCHNRERSPFVKLGDEVKAGQPLAHVGSTGLSTGPHLHFIMLLNGSHVDPLPYITSTPPAPAEKAKESMTKNNAGFTYTRSADKAVVHLIVNTDSGFVFEFTKGPGGAKFGGDVTNPVATTFGTGPFAVVDEYVADALKRSAKQVRDSRVSLPA